MRWNLLIPCVLAYAQASWDVYGNPGWQLSLNGDEKKYHNKERNLTIIADDKSVIVDCGGQMLNCSWLPTLNLARNGQKEKLHLNYCSLNGSISCVLKTLNVNVTALYLLDWKTEITAETVSGLDRLKIFMVWDSDAITRIPVEAFKQLPALRGIRLSGTSIRNIPDQVFSELGGLNISFLEISRAKITEIQSRAFQGLKRLIDLRLCGNGIQTVDKDAFKGLPLVEVLVLQNNPIADLPAGVFDHIPKLKTLNLKDHRADLQLKKDTLAGLTKLKWLTITMFNESYRLSLEEQSLSGLPSLTYCDLSEAGLQELPKDLFKGTKALDELKLNDNKLRLLPENIFEDLVNLKKLSLSNNKLQDQIANFSSNNDGPFSTTVKLETLNLANNSLRNISDMVFIGLSSLKNLDLSYNQLNFKCRIYINEGKFVKNISLGKSPLKNLMDLQTLDLSHNNLTSICNDFLLSMTLEKLNLSHNKIPALTSEEIQFISTGNIDLRYNQITSILPRIQQGKQNANLLLGHNPYNCDCKNYMVLRELKNLKYNMSDAKCSEPKSLEGSSLISIAEARHPTSLYNLTCVLADTPNNCKCLVRPSINMTECACDEVVTNLPDPNNLTIYYLIDQEVTAKYGMLLKLKTINKLEKIPNFVTNLSLANLSLETIPNIPKHIRYVNLTNNNLKKIPKTLLSRNLTFSLNNNPFQCSCEGQNDIKNLQDSKSKIYDYSSLKCHGGNYVGMIHLPHLCKESDQFSIVIAIAIAVSGLLVAVLLILAYKYKLEILIWLYNQGWTNGLFNHENTLDASKKFDIFLSYCHEDEDYVVNELLLILDAKYKVCVHTRDFIPGHDIMTQIYRAVADSRRTVIVASKAYFESPWCLEEMRAAYKQTEVDQRIRAVVILRKDVDPKSEDISETVRSYLNLNTWIGEKDSRFWYRLCYFLPRDVTVEDLRLIEVTNRAIKNLSGQLNKVFVHDGKFGIDNKTGEVNSNLDMILCESGKADNIPALNDEVRRFAVRNNV